MNTPSPTPSPEALAAIAREVAQTAADRVRARRRELFAPTGHAGETAAEPVEEVTTKSTPTDPVTVVDTESESLIRDLLARQRPGDAVLGEEAGGADRAPAGVRWVVDPIDGTVNFLYGIPAYAVSLAAQIDGVSVAGAVVDVAREVTYWAFTGGGAWESSASGTRRLQANPVREVSMALVATGTSYDARRRREQGRLLAELLPRIRDIRRVGAAALDLCMVASGAVDAQFEHGLSPWDWAAGGLIAQEAGARVVVPSADSRSADGHLTIAAAPGIADDLFTLIRTAGGWDPMP
ncbi:MAG: inositol monophosphatase family protein [Gordonia sp. (in: high G+C Gram-positive bacteria)]|uniref:inositol monophosphatase family protein n=1 Tax=Gordonia sp. (in: high G+C Gram-positive bacteria) TaxID=84139 RepID=UPI0039E6CD2C